MIEKMAGSPSGSLIYLWLDIVYTKYGLWFKDASCLSGKIKMTQVCNC